MIQTAEAVVAQGRVLDVTIRNVSVRDIAIPQRKVGPRLAAHEQSERPVFRVDIDERLQHSGHEVPAGIVEVAVVDVRAAHGRAGDPNGGSIAGR